METQTVRVRLAELRIMGGHPIIHSPKRAILPRNAGPVGVYRSPGEGRQILETGRRHCQLASFDRQRSNSESSCALWVL